MRCNDNFINLKIHTYKIQKNINKRKGIKNEK